LSVKSDEKEVEVGVGDGFANDVFSAGFLVKGLLVYICYIRIGVILWKDVLWRMKKIENLNRRCCGIFTQQRVIEYLKISEQYNNI